MIPEVIPIEHVVIIFISILTLLLGFNSIRHRPINSNGVTTLVNKLDKKDDVIISLKKNHAEEIAKKDLIIERQNEQLANYTNQITYLRVLVGEKDDSKEELDFARPALLLVTTASDIRETDEIALNRAGIPYRRISEADKEAIGDELRRRRQEGRMYRYIVFSAHMCDEGIMLHDGTILESYWLNVNLSGVELLILNGCESTSLADDLVGVTDYVISMSEKIPNTSAGSFLFAFWNKMRETDDVLEAYAVAKTMEPSVSPYVDIQMKGT